MSSADNVALAGKRTWSTHNIYLAPKINKNAQRLYLKSDEAGIFSSRMRVFKVHFFCRFRQIIEPFRQFSFLGLSNSFKSYKSNIYDICNCITSLTSLTGHLKILQLLHKSCFSSPSYLCQNYSLLL